MATQLIFSIETMKACNGNAITDGSYLKWFLQECVSRLQTAAKDISDMADGQTPFTADTLAVARARLGEVRLYSEALIECATWFQAKPAIEKQFLDARQATAASATMAEGRFKKLVVWLA